MEQQAPGRTAVRVIWWWWRGAGANAKQTEQKAGHDSVAMMAL